MENIDTILQEKNCTEIRYNCEACTFNSTMKMTEHGWNKITLLSSKVGINGRQQPS